MESVSKMASERSERMAMARFFAVLFAALLAPAAAVHAAEDVNSVLKKLDAAAASFHSTSADFRFQTDTTDPIPETEVQTGSIYYERKGKAFQMAAHIKQGDGRPVPKTYMFAGGVFKLWEGGGLDQVTTFQGGSKYESYLMLGFGASGKELQEKWEVKYDGDEAVGGVNTAKLELVAKDPNVRKNIPKVTVWMDTARGISLKQYFDEGQGQSRTATYSDIKLNGSLPGDAFTLPTDKNTKYVNR
jgi:outer membrane lipoprotein-sorting protein